MISVIMPVYNAWPFIKQAVQSILNQSEEDFELIIVDDCSDDESYQYLQSCKDSRIRLFRNQRRLGVAAALNRGVALARRKYIARMDADDIAYRDRFARQAAFLQKHTDVGVVGTNVRLIDEHGAVVKMRQYPVEHESIVRTMIRTNPINHASVMYRTQLVAQFGGYDERLDGAEDYDLWLRYAGSCKLANIPQALLDYRVSSASVSYQHIDRIQSAFVRAKIKAVMQYQYPWYHLSPIPKALFMLVLPTFVKQKAYTHFYDY